MDWIESAVSDWVPLPVQRLAPLSIPREAYDARRGQYESGEIMKAVSRCAPGDAVRILGITEADLMIPTLTFVFGQAQLNGRLAVVSLARLRQEFYALPADEALLRERVAKEVLHELGHTAGLTHCADPHCVMSLATDITFVDRKDASYCPRCGVQIARRLAGTNGDLL
jgi:archaemetzincin